jgi:hypothetical protein
MSFDTGDRVPPRKEVNLWHLPDVLAVEVHHVRYKRPRRHTIQGKDHEISEAVEITIETSEPFIIRALNPALFVGDIALTATEGEGNRRYRFLALQPDNLKPGMPISIAWNSYGAPRKATNFAYQPPAQLGEER